VEPQYLSTLTAAKILGLSRRTLEKWRSLGGGPPFLKLRDKRVVYVRQDLDAWALARRRCSTCDPGSDE
jgi:hypothetical protein